MASDLKTTVAVLTGLLSPLSKWRHFVPGMGGQSLVSRLLGLVLLGAVAVYLAVNVGLWWTSSRLIEDNLEKQASGWLAELDELGTPHYASGGNKHLASIDRRIKNFPEIAYIRYYDASGTKVLGEYGGTKGKEIPALTPDEMAELAHSAGDRDYIVSRSLLHGAYMRFIAPVRVKSIRSDGLLNFSLDSKRAENEKIVGYIDLSIDFSYYKDQLVRSMATGSLLIAALLLFALIFGRRMIRKALAPLTELQVPLARLAKGETDVEVVRAKDAEIAVISDALNATIRAIKERDEALRKMAESDPLTGLVNRSYFARVLEEEIEQVTSNGTESAVYFIDLDKFKQVNDVYGHAAGDKLLNRVAELLKSQVSDEDVVSRLGGDEFTVLARNMSREGAVELAGSFNRILSETHVTEGEQTFGVSCSIGIAMIIPGKHTADEILSHADAACFASKSKGRNCSHVYEYRGDGKTESAMDISWFKLIQETIREDRFVLVYQPIIDSTDSGKECYEVLLRMPGPNGELVLPSTFLPMAQRFGLMPDIDRWVVVHAMRTLADLLASGREIVFSINLSGHALEDASFLALVKEQMTLNHLPPGCVIYEINEQSALRHLENLKHLIQGLKGTGCRFALDNFGTGFSSFVYLKNLPVDFIKIDGSFVNSMAQNAIDETMVLSIIHIARSLGMKTVAEFVPDEKTMAMLKQAGVDYMQGFYLGVPSERLRVNPPMASAARKKASEDSWPRARKALN